MVPETKEKSEILRNLLLYKCTFPSSYNLKALLTKTNLVALGLLKISSKTKNGDTQFFEQA